MTKRKIRVDSNNRVDDKKARRPTSVSEGQTETDDDNVKAGRAIFIIDNASLKKGFVKKKLRILHYKEHANFLKRQGKNLDDYRPDIVYQVLRAIFDSPLNKAGMVGAIYVKTDNGALFEIKPHVRIPRSLKRFRGLMLTLLEKSYLRCSDTGEVLARVLEGPVTRHLPDNAHIIGLSQSSQKLVLAEDYVMAVRDDLIPVFVVGAVVNGEVRNEYIDDYVSISNLPVCAEYRTRIICEALQHKWDVFSFFKKAMMK